MLDLALLFSSALLAATLLPAQSELLLAALHHAGQHPAWLLGLVATMGNVLGSLINWWIGRYLITSLSTPIAAAPEGAASPSQHHYGLHQGLKRRLQRWFPINQRALTRASQTYARYGVWTLLLAWLPIIGDPLTLIAGIFRTRLILFIPLVTLGKAARYAAILAVTPSG